MRKFLLIGISCIACLYAHSQTILDIKDKRFNYGAKIGMDATFPIVRTLSINNAKAENILTEYQVGWEATIFCRINFNRFFIQPNLSWSKANGSIRFYIPDPSVSGTTGVSITNSTLHMEAKSINAPILIGYNLVREDPYGLSFMIGPKFRYNYNNLYTYGHGDNTEYFQSTGSPYGISITTAIGVNIGRLFFDFMYDFGINRTETEFQTQDSPIPTSNTNLLVSKRVNSMSISLGFLF